jgi:hypothetical protein
MNNEIRPLIQGLDLEACRLNQDFGSGLGVRKAPTRIAVRKPNKTEFFRVSKDPEHRFSCWVLHLQEEGETYLVTSAASATLPNLLRPAELRLAVDRHGNAFIIPAHIPDPDGRTNPWHQSLNLAVEEAEDNWVRVTANMKNGSYDLYIAEGNLAPPKWPEQGFTELLSIAFRNRVIDSVNHPVVEQLLGRQ